MQIASISILGAWCEWDVCLSFDNDFFISFVSLYSRINYPQSLTNRILFAFSPSLQMSGMNLVQLSAITICLLMAQLRIHGSNACKISEFPCRGGALCLPLDKYCDGRDDCGDASDEPKYCTGNSNYYPPPAEIHDHIHHWWPRIIAELFIEMSPTKHILAIASVCNALNCAHNCARQSVP